MSDNLSEEEINALLTPESEQLTPALEDFVRIYQRIRVKAADILESLVGKTCRITDPKVLLTSPEEVLDRISEEVIDVQVPMKGAYAGLHSYYLSPEDAAVLSGAVMGMEDVTLDETAMSALGETFSQVMGVFVGYLNREFSEDVTVDAPKIARAEKTALNLPRPVFTLEYDVIFGEGNTVTLVEVFNRDLAETVGKLFAGGININTLKPERSKAEGVSFPKFKMSDISPQEEQNLGLLMDVPVMVTVELGRVKWQLRDVLTLGEGSIVELDKQAGEPVDILVNNNLIARGEVVVVDENFSVRITEIITTFEQMMQKAL